MTEALTILDGGMGKELARIGAPFQQPEWSAQALIDDPTWVRRAHQNFVDAGAQVITANTYAVVPHHLGDDRFAARGSELASLAADIAREVADNAEHKVLVAGSIPPLFGSYSPADFEPGLAPAAFDVLVEAQRGRVDLWIGETISSIEELHAILAALAVEPEPVWVSFTVDDDVEPGECQLRSGESVTAGVEAALAAPNPVAAVLFNCSQPERIGVAVAEAVAALDGTDVAVGAYANAFVDKEEGYASNGVILDHRSDLTPEVYAGMAREWIDLGASIIGGCCGIRPDHIAALAALR